MAYRPQQHLKGSIGAQAMVALALAVIAGLAFLAVWAHYLPEGVLNLG